MLNTGANNMKLQTSIFVALITLTSTASAGWFDWMGNNNAGSNAANNATVTEDGNAATMGNGMGNTTGSGSGKGDAAGEVDFSINFKGRGKADMDAQTQGVGSMQSTGNATGDAQGNGEGAGSADGTENIAGSGASELPVEMSLAQMKEALMVQMKLMDGMLKQIEAQEKMPK